MSLKENPRVALFRAAEQAAQSARRLAEAGYAAVLAPVLEIGAVEAALPQGAFDFVLATSPHAFAQASPALLAIARNLPAYVVGERTAEAARAAAVAQLAQSEPDAATLARKLRERSGRALYLAGRDRKPDLEAALGARLEAVVVYAACERAGWSASEAHAVAGAAAALHYSARSAELAARFAEAAGVKPAFGSLTHICLSRDVAAPLLARGASARWPKTPTESELLSILAAGR